MFYYMYETKNNVNGMIYIGVHRTSTLDDGYVGSGKRLSNAIKKYGIENLTKTILEQFDDSISMYAREKEVVTDDFISREDTYNLRRGGFGGFDHIHKDPRNREWMQRGAAKRLEMYPKLVYQNILSEHSILSSRQTKITKYGSLNGFHIGTKRPESTKKKMSESGSGEKNSQFGSMWITNETESKKIKKTDPIPEGWRKGRKINVAVKPVVLAGSL